MLDLRWLASQKLESYDQTGREFPEWWPDYVILGPKLHRHTQYELNEGRL